MKTERWQKIEEIFHNALACSPTQRANYLNHVCEEDITLRQEIESLIAFSDEAQDVGFLKTAAVNRQVPVWSLEALIGQIIDNKYRIEKQLGQGGMGAVYLATHLGTGRTVAIKIIAPQYMGYTEFVERFKREAEATGRLRHPNVINVTDFGFSSVGSDKLAYLVMEYLTGETLGNLLKEKGKLPLDLVVDIVEQICLAVEEAHKIGIIHRDLKPENVWLEPNGRGGYNVKVLDFGLAKLRDVPNSFQNLQLPLLERLKLVEESANETKDVLSFGNSQKYPDEQITLKQYLPDNSTAKVTHGNIDPKTVPVWLTRGGTILGTPLYMSPEQCHGKSLDNRSDVYSAGIMTYQMLTGETPFTGDFHQLINKHTNMPVPIIKENSKKVPKLVGDTIMTALAKNPADRPKSMMAFATALKANAQTQTSLIRQAISIYSNNFVRFLVISFLAYFPLVFIVTLLFAQIAWYTSINSYFSSQFSLSITDTLFATTLLFFIPLIPFYKLAHGSLIIPAVLKVITSGNENLSLSSLVTDLKTKQKALGKSAVKILIGLLLSIVSVIVYILSHHYFPPPNSLELSDHIPFMTVKVLPFLAFSLLSIWLLRDYEKNVLYEATVVAEGLTGTEATTRSIFLVKKGKKNKKTILFALSVMFTDLIILSFSLVWTANKVLRNKPSDVDVFMVVLACVVGVYVISLLAAIIAPLLTISDALFYLKTRQSSGETLDEIFEKYQNSISN